MDQAAGATPALVVADLHKAFGSLEVLKGVSLSAQNGDVISMIGSSGSGKSTLLRCINLLEVPDSGEVHVGGELIRMTPRPGMAPGPPTGARSTASARASAWCSRASICGRT